MKNKLIVLYEEDRKDPKNTWSGTSYQLREALKEYYDVIFIDSYDIYPIKLIKMISKKIEKRTASYIIKPIYEKLHEIEINIRLRKYKSIPVLEICENVIIKNDFYLYRDMAYACYPYVLNKLKDDNNDYGHGMLNSISKKALKQRIKREEKIHKKTKGEFYMGQWVVDLMKEHYPQYEEKLIHAGGGFSSEFSINIENEKKDNIKRILFVGIDFKRKGGKLLVDAYKQIRDKYGEKVELIIVGPNIVKKEDGINYVGKINRKELSNIFQKCDIYCMPSRFEAYGLVFIEALCYGLPIVAYNDFEMKYFVQNEVNGILINDYSADALAIALESAINSSSLKSNVEKNKKDIIKTYCWNSVAKTINGII